MDKRFSPLGTLPADVFLREYWQRKPLLVRQALAGFRSPVSADELAGLACEDEVHARIVVENGADHPWQVIYGPMREEQFASLPETHWTLLVNDVEKLLPGLGWIVDAFRFIPEWRLDDLMISYASPGGSVGPHMDQYDTFILQAEGERRWQLSSAPVAAENQVADTQLRIQKHFKAEQEWVLHPGDLIYIPPGVSHHGVALEDCITYSIGFRAPTHAEMLGSFIDFLSEGPPGECTYRDPVLSAAAHPNEISDAVLQGLRRTFARYLELDNTQLARWFGRFVSDTRVDIDTPQSPSLESFEALCRRHQRLLRSTASRFAFAEQGPDAWLFVNGEEYRVPAGFARALCRQRAFDLQENAALLNADTKQLLLELYRQGSLMPVLQA